MFRDTWIKENERQKEVDSKIVSINKRLKFQK